MRHGSLFNGIGGFQLAAQWMGWENVFSCEIDKFCNRVTKYHFPNCIQYEDIKQTDFTIHRGNIDILSGGFPCQPYSAAGKRLGKEDDRHLWPQMLRAVREIQPGYVVGENVRGLTNWNGGMVFDEVQADLEAEGYEVLPFLLPACAVDAPHRRDRIWFVAYAKESIEGNNSRANTKKKSTLRGNETGDVLREYFGDGITSNTKSGRAGGLRIPCKKAGPFKSNFTPGGIYRISFASNTTIIRGNETEWERKGKSIEHDKVSAPGTWQNFPTQSPVCGGDDGLPGELDGITFSKWRQESIKGYGNAIVPQVAYEIFKAIEQCEAQINP